MVMVFGCYRHEFKGYPGNVRELSDLAESVFWDFGFPNLVVGLNG
jgi:hypothetical protein